MRKLYMFAKQIMFNKIKICFLMNSFKLSTKIHYVKSWGYKILHIYIKTENIALISSSNRECFVCVCVDIFKKTMVSHESIIWQQPTG